MRRLREQRGLKQSELGQALTDLGRPMSIDVVSKLEKGSRPMDVDDLVAFAVALDATPNDLLLPPEDSDEQVELTPVTRVSNRDAWHWARQVQDLTEASGTQTLPHLDAIVEIGKLLDGIEAAGGPLLRQLTPVLEMSTAQARARRVED